MILPNKHITLSESYFGLAGVLLKILEKPMTVDELYQEYLAISSTGEFTAYHDFDDVILSLDLLYSMSAIKLQNDGRLMYENS